MQKKLFIKSFDNYIEKNSLPIPWAKFDVEQQNILKKCYDHIKTNIIGSNTIADEYALKFSMFIREDSVDTQNPNKGKLAYYRALNNKETYNFNKFILSNLWNSMMKPKITIKSDKMLSIKEFKQNLKEINEVYDSKAMTGPEKGNANYDFFVSIDIEAIKLNIESVKEKTEKEEYIKKKLAEEIEKSKIFNQEEKLRLEEEIKNIKNELKQTQLDLKIQVTVANEQTAENEKLKNREKEALNQNPTIEKKN